MLFCIKRSKSIAHTIVNMPETMAPRPSKPLYPIFINMENAVCMNILPRELLCISPCKAPNEIVAKFPETVVVFVKIKNLL